MDSLTPELKRRLSCAGRLEALFRSRPGEWISMRELAQVGGIGGWRTRCSELATRKVDPLHIEWNKKNGLHSAHRYQPPALRPWTVEVAEDWTLTP